MSEEEHNSIKASFSPLKNENLSESNNVIESGPSSLVYSGDNEEEYLRTTWRKLGVGENGFLSLEELTKVCYAIGMEKVASEIIEQLFSRLDVDGDGQISFEEFLHMFQSGGPAASHSFSLDDSINQESGIVSSSGLGSITNNSGIYLNEYGGLFSSLDPEGSGFISVSRIIEIWFALGVNDGRRVLRELGLPHRQGERIRTQDFSAALEDEWRPSQDASNSVVNTRQVAFLTLLHEIKALRLSVESARAERDKYRWNLNETNHRLTLLSQELDEHTAQLEASSRKKIQELEKSHREQLRELQQALSREMDLARDQASTESREIHHINTQHQQEENRLKSCIESLEGDIRRLESENLDLNDRLKESDHHIFVMDRQIVELKQLKCKVAEFESLSPREEEYRSMLQRVDLMAADNQRLRDENDELISQIDSFSSKNSIREKLEDHSLDGSCIGDYMDQSNGFLMGGLKRRGGASSWCGEDGGEEVSGPEDESPRGKKVRKCSVERDLNFHYMDVSAHDESFEVSMTMPGSEKTALNSSCGSSSGTSTLNRYSVHSGSPQLLLQPRSLPQGRDRGGGLTAAGGSLSESSSEDHRFDNRKKALLSADEMEMEQDSSSSSFKGSSPFFKPCASTPLKQLHSPNDKCLQCVELENRLIVALEEAEAALTQKDEEAREKMRLQTLLQSYRRKFSNSESSGGGGGGSEANSFKEDSVDCSHQQTDVLSTSKVRVEALEEQCLGLEGELVKVRFEVANMVEERQRIEKENERLKNKILKRTQGVSKTMKRRCRDLTERLKRKRMALASPANENLGGSLYYPPSHLIPLARDAITTILEVDECEEEDAALDANPEEDKEVDDVRRAEQEDDLEEEEEDLAACTPTPLEHEMDVLEREVSLYEEEMIREREGVEKQKCAIEDRCARLQQEMEISKSEIKKSEEYWSQKFKEEQDFYESERNLYDQNFAALESKIREYEEVVLSPGVPSEIVLSGVGNMSEDSDRLSTIDESVQWEKQVNELEDEVNQLKVQIHHMQEEKDLSIIKLEEKLVEEKELALKEISSLKEELETAKILQKTYETQIAATNEKLEIAQRIAQHKNESYFQDDLSEDANEATSSAQVNHASKYEEHICKLRSALKLNQKNSFETLHKMNKMHKTEVQSLETRITATEQMFRSTLAKYKDQLMKASRTDNLVFELYMENTQLMKALELTEARQKQAEESNRRLELAALSTHPSL